MRAAASTSAPRPSTCPAACGWSSGSHCEDGGTLLWIFTTVYVVGPYNLSGPKLQTGERPPGKSLIFDRAVTNVRRFERGAGVRGRLREQADGGAPGLNRSLFLDEEARRPLDGLGVRLVPGGVAGAHPGVVAALRSRVGCRRSRPSVSVVTPSWPLSACLVGHGDEAERHLDARLVVAQEQLGEVLLLRSRPPRRGRRRSRGEGGSPIGPRPP